MARGLELLKLRTYAGAVGLPWWKPYSSFFGGRFGGRKNLGNSRLFRHFWEIPPNSDQKFVDVAMAAMWVF